MPVTSNWSVVVDFVVEKGLLFLLIRNHSDNPAFNVKIKSNMQIRFSPFAGNKPANTFFDDLPIFKGITYLAPRKEIRVFVDGFLSYMMHGQPMKIMFTVTFDTPDGLHVGNNILHDLGIFRGIGAIESIEKESAVCPQ